MRKDLAQLAGQQDGVVSRRNMIDLGLTKDIISGLVQRYVLQRVAPQVFVICGAPTTRCQQLRIGLLALGDESWISFEAAAVPHGFDRSPDHAVEFSVLRSNRSRHIHDSVHTTKWMPMGARVRVDGLRVTSATRTILDLALARSPRSRLEAAIDSAVRLQLSAPTVIARRLETLRGSGRWGVRTIDALLPDSGGHSMLERRFLELVREAGLPRPRTQVVHRKGSRHIARVDFLFEDHGIVIEVNGRCGHASDAERERDGQRRGELTDLGLLVYEYTWNEITKDPYGVARTLRERLAAHDRLRTQGVSPASHTGYANG